jgi:hypothetical protein
MPPQVLLLAHSPTWVEQVRQTDTMRLRNKSEQMPVTVEAPRATVLHYFEARFVMAIEQLVGNAASRPFVGELHSLRAKPLDADYRDDLIRQNASDCGGGLEVFEAGHVFSVGGMLGFNGKSVAASVNPLL